MDFFPPYLLSFHGTDPKLSNRTIKPKSVELNTSVPFVCVITPLLESSIILLLSELETTFGTSLVMQWIGLHTPSAGGPGSIPSQGTRSHIHAATESPHATTKEPWSRN